MTMVQPSGTETTNPMTPSRNPAPTSARRLVMMTPPYYSACEHLLCEKNSARGVGRKTGKKYFEGGSFGARRAAHTHGHLHRSLFGAATPHAPTISYEGAKKRAEPYTKIVEELPEMRRETVELVREAITENR